MTVAIQRNEILHLDGYEWDKLREEDKPLLSQLANDLIDNGFVDVGPEIVKITSTDEQLTEFIDNIIVYFYDSSINSELTGAFGLFQEPIETDGFTSTFTSYSLDNNPNYTKLIDDLYDNDNWNNFLATEFPSNRTTSTAYSLYKTGKFLGPNAELFAYLNPHPNKKTSNGWLKKLPPEPGRPRNSNDQQGYIGLSSVSKRIYDNEFAKIKRLVTNSARGVGFYPLDTESNQSYAVASVRQYKEEVTKTGVKTHSWWISTYKNEKFFPNTIIEPVKYEGDFSLSPSTTNTEYQAQWGDTYTISITKTPVGTSGTPLTVTYDYLVENTPFDIFRDSFLNTLKEKIGNNVNGIVDAKDSYDGVVSVVGKNYADDITLSYTRTPYVNEVFTNAVIDSNYTGLRTLFGGKKINFSAKPESPYHLYGLVENGSLGKVPYWEAGRSPSMHSSGYVHGQTISGINGMNPNDKFSVDISGVVDESAEEPWNAASTSIGIEFVADKKLTSTQAAIAIAAEIKTIDYVKNYMNVYTSGDNILIEYNQNSSAWLVRTDKATTGNYGLLNLESALWKSAFSAGYITSTVTNWWNTNSTVKKFNPDGSGTYTYSSIESVPMAVVAPFYTSPNAIFADDVPALAKFSTSITYTSAVVPTDDPISFVLNENVAAQASNVESVKVSFPLARDLGTLANPPTTSSGSWILGIHNRTSISNYPISYYHHVLHETASATDITRPSGPEISLDFPAKPLHPNVTHPGITQNGVSYSDFSRIVCGLPIDSFEYVNDYSIGPIVFETSSSNSLSGQDGTQPWRIRFDVSRGYEIVDGSAFLHVAHQQFSAAETYSSYDSSPPTTFEYLTCHVATKYQLKENGDITEQETTNYLQSDPIREIGYLGAARPQFSAYGRSAISALQPYADRSTLDVFIKNAANRFAGRVGIMHDSIEGISLAGIKPVWPNTVDDVSYTASDGTVKTVTTGLLTSGEYRYEDLYLTGTSTELLYDTPYNKGGIRIQKGFFRRSGKNKASVASTYPMTYNLTIASHGIVFNVYDHASIDQSDDNAWFVIQRHVDSTTGEPDWDSTTQPVHCIYQTSEPPVIWSDLTPYFLTQTNDAYESVYKRGLFDINGNYITDFYIDEVVSEDLRAFNIQDQGRFRRFIVREKETLKPWNRHVFAGINEVDSFAVINPLEQLSLNEQGQLIIQFPNRLGSQRYFYTGKELDLIAFCDAGAVGQDTIVTSDRFTTPTVDKRRYYNGGPSTKAFGNGMRLMYLVAGWGVDSTFVADNLLN